VFSSFNPNTVPPDTILLSSDGEMFTVHYHALSSASSNNFAGLLVCPADPFPDNPVVILVNEPSDVLSIILHSLYNLSYTKTPSFRSIVSSIGAFKKYGLVPLQKYLAPSMPLYDTLLFYAPLYAAETYTLAAEEGLEELAVSSSAYTLAMKLCELPEDWVVRMGVLYWHRLIRLHGTRMDALKNILETKLYPHVAQPHCSIMKRRETNNAYDLACAQIFYDASPGQSYRSVLYMYLIIRCYLARLSNDMYHYHYHHEQAHSQY
jgi:hypothetical protein